MTNPGILQALCAFCRTLLIWDKGAILSQGQHARLAEGFTRLWTGATVDLRGRSGTVLGRARFRFDTGLWDHWWVDRPGGGTWVVEDDHELALDEEVEVPPDLDAEALRTAAVGTIHVISGARVRIIERGHAECVGIEGALPAHVVPGERFFYVDGASLDGRVRIDVEFHDQGVRMHRGEWLHEGQIRT